MAEMTQQARQEFLAAPHIGVLSVADGGDRPPLTVPIWYAYDPGGSITFFTGTMGRKTRKKQLIARAGRVSFCVQREEYPYKYVTVEGTVERIDEPPSEAQMLAIVRRYLPEDAALGMVRHELSIPDSELVLYTVRPDNWLTMDLSNGTREE